MAISDQDDDDTFEIPKQQAHSKSVLHDESTPSAWFDPNVIPPEPIKAFRERYNETKNSENPEDREEILSAYRSIADDPELFAQLQPIDFMMAMNSCRDLFHMIPRMRHILDEATTTVHGRIPELYHIILKGYTKLSDYKGLDRMVDLMRDRNIEFNTATYHILLDKCRHNNNLKDAIGIFGQMRKKNVEVTAATYLIMITICARVKNPTLASRYFHEMPMMGLELETAHYNALLNAYANASDHTGAKRVFQMLEDDGIQPDVYTYAAMVKDLVNSRQAGEAKAL
ncbi:hypothetical protein BGX31_004487, partial [Mortierella sp. GBA43]